uniref:C2H2-type domain-containing protein n=1 Tax=Bracon brevicornis TaxID=1563983 RepID=A0A6V7M7Z7_9HYME
MAATTSRMMTRSVTTVRPAEMTLNLDCVEEELSEAQLAFQKKVKEDYDKVMATMEEIMKKDNGQLITKTNTVSGYQYSVAPTANTMVKPVTLTQAKQPIKLNVLNNTSSSQGNIQLVVDPRMGLILNTVPQNQNTTPNIPQKNVHQVTTEPSQFRPTRQNPIRAKMLPMQQPQAQPDIIEEIPKEVTKPPPKPASNPTPIAPTPETSLIKTKPPLRTVTVKPTEQTSIGGLAVGVKNADTIDESKRHLPDGREIAFNKMNGGRTYPSLVVVARPFLKSKEIPQQLMSKERSELDAKVKSVLMYSSTRFAEWLIQQGLVKSEQFCTQQHNCYPRPKLKLAMYSDAGTFPYSGGYVWISSCCPDRYVSVFSGSIFQGATHTPAVLLKLIYHWSCQTNVQNVVSWVKVSNTYVKNFYTNLRSVCTAAIWDKSPIIGGRNKNVQVGVISLGTTSQDGNLRQVKVEVLGILNPDTGELRLRACEPLQDNVPDRNGKKRFNNILQPLSDWVHKDSRILTDFTVDKTILNELGFNNVLQVAYNNSNARHSHSNYQIMEYLRKIVPRMFQNTLSLLSRQMIQQFLDELVWREMFGNTASRAFTSIINHIAEQTRAQTGDSLLDRLAKIGNNPFRDWSYSKFIANTTHYVHSVPSSENSKIGSVKDISGEISVLSVRAGSSSANRRSRKRQASSLAGPEAKRFEPERDMEQVPLHEYFYASVDGEKSREDKKTAPFSCFLCPGYMRWNTEVMEHMLKHVPPRVPGQTFTYACRYCCAAFSTRHQMQIHVAEAHSSFGVCDGHMVVCGICEQKFSNSNLLISHMVSTHLPSEMPYKCEACGYRTSSHKDAIDHFYKNHERGEFLQCPYCLKVIQYSSDGTALAANIQAFLVHMQRHIVRTQEGKGNKCSRCCLWFNQKSALRQHQRELHMPWVGAKNIPDVPAEKRIIIPRIKPQQKNFYMSYDNPPVELPDDDVIQRWPRPINLHVPSGINYRCQECEEDIDEEDHYPGEQKCEQCRYVTCCWRAFKEHQQQIHNERPMTSILVPSPLVNLQLERKMKCSCGYGTRDGNLLASHFAKCKKGESRGSTGMLDSLGLVPKKIEV